MFAEELQMVKEKVLELANKISRTRRGSKNEIKPEYPEYRILEPVVTDEMAEVALCLELHEPVSKEEVAARCARPVAEVGPILYQLAKDGVIRFVTREGVDRFCLDLWVPGVMEFMVNNRENVKKYPQIAECFEEYGRRRGPVFAGNIPVGLGLMRVIPIEKSIAGETRRASYEEVSKYLNENSVFSVSDCACRVTRIAMGEGCGHLAEDMCIQLGDAAEFYIRTARGRRITREEAFAILDKAEKAGLIHQIPNTEGPGMTHAICNCCGCSCLSLRTAAMYRSPDSVRSNYIATVDKKKCVACGECVENCQVNAPRLGQSLCAIVPAAEREIELPCDTEWGPDKWNPDYRSRKVVADGGTSPCKTECPAHIAVQGYIKMAAQGRYREALELIKKENPLPAVCGRICPRGCESVCTRSHLDDPIAIDEIKKFIADQDLKSEQRFVPEKNAERPEKIAVIGAGPAGLSCAYFLAVDGYQVTLFEKEKVLGGMLMMGIPSFRLGKEVVKAEIDVLRQLGVEFKTGVEVGKDVSLPQLRELGFKAFYVAIGAQAGRTLGLVGEDAEGVLTGVDFLRQVILDGQIKLPGQVLVIGGGNVAIDVARTAARVGASQVDMVCLEGRQEMPALEEEIEEASAEGIGIHNSWGPARILTEGGRVTGVEFRRCTSVFDENRRFNPRFDDQLKKIVKANHVLISIGQAMVWGGLLDGSGMRLNPNKTLIADPLTWQTGEPDVFAGGDAVTGPRFAIDAIALGKQGAISIHRYVHGHNLTISREREYHAFDQQNVNLEGFDRKPRQRPLHVDGTRSRETFQDLRRTFTEEQVKAETKRCLGCGAAEVDAFMCVGCGVCTTKCKFDAISLVRRYDRVNVELHQMKPAIMKYILKRRVRIAGKKIRKSMTSLIRGRNGKKR